MRPFRGVFNVRMMGLYLYLTFVLDRLSNITTIPRSYFGRGTGMMHLMLLITWLVGRGKHLKQNWNIMGLGFNFQNDSIEYHDSCLDLTLDFNDVNYNR